MNAKFLSSVESGECDETSKLTGTVTKADQCLLEEKPLLMIFKAFNFRLNLISVYKSERLNMKTKHSVTEHVSNNYTSLSGLIDYTT